MKRMNKVVSINAKDLSELSDKPLVLLPLEEYERMQEDLEMLRSSKLPRRVAKARADIKSGKFVTLETVKQGMPRKT